MEMLPSLPECVFSLSIFLSWAMKMLGSPVQDTRWPQYIW
jgi:hypothetical protein